MQTSIFSLDFFLFRFRLSSQGSSRPLFFRCDYSDRFRCQSKVGIFCKSCVRVETTLRVSLSSALLRFLKSIQNWANVYIFLPVPKVTLSLRKIQTKNKQSHGTVQSYQIVYWTWNLSDTYFSYLDNT